MQVLSGEVDVILHPVIRSFRLAELRQKGHHLLISQAVDLFLFITAEDDHHSGKDIQNFTVIAHQGPVQGKSLDLAFLVDRDTDPFVGSVNSGQPSTSSAIFFGQIKRTSACLPGSRIIALTIVELLPPHAGDI